MTYENKPPLFGPSAVFDPATYEPRSGKSFWMAATAMARMNIEFGKFLFGDDDNSVFLPVNLPQAKRAYVTGVGWCWMSDGEIIEVIHMEGLDDGLDESPAP